MSRVIKSTYWVVTGLMVAFMMLGSVPDVLQLTQAVSFIRHLGYPSYLLPFLGIAKIVGIVAVLVPSPRTIKEWAYAGLVIDLTGALYSHLSVGDSVSAWAFPVIGLVLVGGSYLLHRLRTSPFEPSASARTSPTIA
jgi:DoxX-like protein